MTLRVAISGAGYVVPFHLKAWQKAGAEVVAICDPALDRAEERARTFSIPRIYPDLDAMLAEVGFDAVDIASPREVHVAQSVAALDAGYPVLCQKPVATSLAEAETLRAHLDRFGRLMVHENWRFRPEYRLLTQWVDEGRIGTLRHATIAMRTRALLPDENGIRPALQRQPFFATQERLVVAEVLIHHLDTARRLFGELELGDVSLRRTQEDLPGETQASLLLHAENGARVLVSGDMTAPGAPPGASDRVEICGSKGRAVFEDGVATLFQVAGEIERQDFRSLETLQESFDRAIAHFAARLEDGAAFETSLDDNLRTFALVEAVYSAAGS